MHRRGGVLGALEVNYQRNRIQDEPMIYDIGNIRENYQLLGYIFEEGVDNSLSVEEFDIEVTRSDKEERMMVIDRNKAFKDSAKEAEEGLARLKKVAREGGNLFEVMWTLWNTALLDKSHKFFETGGKFRRNM